MILSSEVARLVDLAQVHSDIPGYLDKLADAFLVAHLGPARGGVSIEVGTRAGGSAYLLASLLEGLYQDKPPMLHSVDPYGDKPYHGGDIQGCRPYGEAFAVAAKRLLARFPHHVSWRMRSLDFLQLAQRPEPLYWWQGEPKSFVGDVTFALLDGEHDLATVRSELIFLHRLLRPGSVVFIDNANVDPLLRPWLRAELDLETGGKPYAIWQRP
jgi:hypothetical protein